MKTYHRPKRKHGRVNEGQKGQYESSPTIAAQAKASLGTPVCVVLKDGSLYYGVLKEVQVNQVILQGFKGTKKLPRNKVRSKAHISSFGGLGNMLGLLGGGGLGGLFGGGSAGGLLGGLGQGAAKNAAGSGGLFSNIGSFMKLGMGVIQFIMPLMKNFSI
ncbi:hypothetical protein [Paenibacillus aceris]|uniref:Uncharacterized protein n=1 Tax=Paenibacillus aceris TaxID=869555 RepID=A0ABS4I6Q7_9BACL|nr:hypothetical protein [Paenibacillus aceris]MBP1966584.1 hypothetical protein [Paenibacillus aceris]NHW38821.1 hypothetical protein [Paenibacillus aceris]